MAKEIIKRWVRVILFVLTILSSLCGSVYAAEEGIEFAVTADYFTKYIWRGQNLNDESVFQPSVSIGKNGFTATIWGNLDLTGENQNRDEFTELDYSIEYSASVPNINGVSFSAGVLYYDFPNTTYEPTTEVYGGLNFDLPLTPYIKLYRDVGEINGGYLQVGIGHSIEKLREFSNNCYCGLELGSSIGYGSSRYNKGYFDTDSEELNDWTSSVALPFCIRRKASCGGALTIKPSISYSTMLNNTIRSATEKSDNFWAGLAASIEF